VRRAPVSEFNPDSAACHRGRTAVPRPPGHTAGKHLKIEREIVILFPTLDGCPKLNVRSDVSKLNVRSDVSNLNVAN